MNLKMVAGIVAMAAGLCWAQNPNQQPIQKPLQQVVQLNQQKADMASQGLQSPALAPLCQDVINNCGRSGALLGQLGYNSKVNPPGQLSNKQWDQRTGYNNGPLPTDNNGRMDGNINNPNEIHPGDKGAPGNIAPMPNAAQFMAAPNSGHLIGDLISIDRQEQALLHQANLANPNPVNSQLFMVVHGELVELTRR